jgi:hypothetical protein
MGYRYGIWCIDVVIYHIDMVILDIDMGYGLMIWEMTVSIWSSPISIWDILSLCSGAGHASTCLLNVSILWDGSQGESLVPPCSSTSGNVSLSLFCVGYA